MAVIDGWQTNPDICTTLYFKQTKHQFEKNVANCTNMVTKTTRSANKILIGKPEHKRSVTTPQRNGR